VKAYYESMIIPHFTVVDKEHSPFLNSAADSVNAGLNVCRTPIYLTIDADTLLEPKALSRIVFAYLTNPHCVAVGGDIYVPDPTKIKNGKMTDTNIPSNFLLGMQVTEYLRSFLYGREGWTALGGALCHPGAFTLLETVAVRDIGGYDSYNFSYDAEIIIKLHHYMRKNNFPYSVVYAPSAICWSEEPQTLRGFWRQRSYWQRGLLRCIALHKQMILNPRYGVTGLLAFPYYILFEIFGPVVEGISYVRVLIMLFIRPLPLINIAWLFFLAWGFMMFITMSCVVLSIITYNKYYRKMDILRFFALTTIDMLFYREYRALCALFSSTHYLINRLRGKPL
jgi:cellulose synthase/poly-beta-1,6-N-acetylglucosamine synthase-like glycosyltransferase